MGYFKSLLFIIMLFPVGLMTELETSELPVVACKPGISWDGWTTPTQLYTYRITSKYSCGFMGLGCCDGQVNKYKVPVGLGVPTWDYTSERKPNGCSGPMIKGDKEVWRVACNIHDIMYSTRPPEGTDEELWRKHADLALMFNMAKICQDIWPAGSPGLGGCFDGVKNTYNYLQVLGLGKESYDKNQRWANNNDKPRLSQANFDAIVRYNNELLERWPVFGTSFDAGRGLQNPE